MRRLLYRSTMTISILPRAIFIALLLVSAAWAPVLGAGIWTALGLVLLWAVYIAANVAFGEYGAEGKL